MDCELMERIATFRPLITVLFSLIILSIFTIPFLIFVTIRIAKNSLYHRNTRVLLVAHGIALILHMVDRIFYHGNELYRWLIIMPEIGPCEIISSKQRCFFFRLGFNIGLWFTTCSTPVITLERYLATRYFSTYQKDKTSWTFLLIFQFSLLSLIMFFAYAGTTFDGFTYYCLSASLQSPTHIQFALFITFFLQLISIVVYRQLITKNKALKKHLLGSGGNLTKRYQVEESLRSLEVLSQPLHTMIIVNSSFMFLISVVHLNGPEIDLPTLYFLIEAFVIIPEYALIFVICFVQKENQVNVKASKSLKLNINTHSEAYFDNYREAWN